MSRSTGVDDKQLADLRGQTAGDGEPLLTKSMSVIGQGDKGRTPYISPTVDGADIAGIEIGDQVEVQVFRDRIVIK